MPASPSAAATAPSPAAVRTSLAPRDMDLAAMAEALIPRGVPASLIGRVFAHVHQHGASSFAGIRGLAAEVAQRLDEEAVWPRLEIVDRRVGADGFLKVLFRCPDGVEVEAVRIPLPASADTAALKLRRRAGLAAPLEALPTAKYTVCVSSQAGCALACDFCATGRLGAIRSLATWEILAQVRAIADEADHPVRGVVFMGMGEPFLNYDAVIRAAGILSHPAGFAISAKAITISTAGMVPGIQRFAAEGHRYRLIVSLGSPTAAQRQRLMPISERRWPIPVLMDAVRAYGDASGQRVTLAYVCIGGPDGNVSPEHARQLGDLLRGLRARLNLIDVTDPSGRYVPPDDDELRRFRDVLATASVPVVRRYSGGADIAASCGNLATLRQGGRAVVG